MDSRPRQDDQDTHRIHLLNGNFIDGKIVERTPEGIVIQWTKSATIKIKPLDIVRVEILTIRTIGVALKTEAVKPITKDQPEEESPTDADSAGKPEFPEAVVKAVESILSRCTSSPGDELLKELHDLGAVGSRYLASRLETLVGDGLSWSIIALSRMTDLKIEGAIRRVLTSARPEVRVGAIKLLWGRNAKSALKAIMKLMRDPSPEVRRAAVVGTANLGNADILAELAEAAFDPADEVRDQAITRTKTLAATFSCEGSLADIWARGVSRRQGAEHGDVVRALGELASKPKGEFPMQSVRDLLIGLLTERNQNLRTATAYALGTMKCQEAAAPIVSALGVEKSAAACAQMCFALGEIGTGTIPGLIDALIAQLRSTSADVKKWAGNALKKITQQKDLGTDHALWSAWWANQR